MAFLCLRFLGIGNSTVGDVLQIQMALLFLLYFAPTPGSSGFAEVFSLSAMAAIVLAGLAPYYNLVWRASTVYLPAGLGLLFLVLTVLRDTRNILRRRVRPHVSRSESPNAVRGSFNTRIPLRTGESFHHGPFPVSAHGGSRLPNPICFGGTRSVRSFPSCRVSHR
jgi:hypothetical protein